MSNFSIPASLMDFARHRGWFSILKMVARTFRAEKVVLCVQKNGVQESEQIHFLGVVRKTLPNGTVQYVESRDADPIFEKSFFDCQKVLEAQTSFQRRGEHDSTLFYGIPFESPEKTFSGVLGILHSPEGNFSETQLDVLNEARAEFQASISRNDGILRNGSDNEVKILGFGNDITSLKAVQSRFDLLVDGSGLGFWDIHLRDGIGTASDNWFKIRGIEYVSRISRNMIYDKVHPDDKTEYRKRITDHLGGKTNFFAFQYRIEHPERGWIWVRSQGRVTYRGPDGTPLWFTAFDMDVTREILDAQNLRNNRNLLQRAMELGKMAYWVCDVERNILVSYSSTLFPMLGLPEQDSERGEYELVPLLKQIIYPADFDGFMEKYFHSGEQDNHLTFRVCLPGGMISYYFLSTTPIKDRNGQIVSRIAVIQDVTDQKIVETTLLEQEKELRDKERRYRMLYDHSSDAIYVVDGDMIIECNRRTLEIFGYSSHEDFFGSNIQLLSAEFQPDGRKSSEVFGERFSRVLQGGTQPFEWLSRRKDGSIFDSVITLAPLYGDKPAIQVIVHDLTEQKTAVRAMENYRSYISLLAEIRKAFYNRSEQEIVQAFLDTAANYFNLRKAWYGMRIGNTIRPVFHAGPDKEFLDIARVKINTKEDELLFPLASAIRDQCPVVLNNLQNDPEFAPWASFAGEANFHSALAIPVEVKNRIEGGVVFYSRMPHAFDESIVGYLHGSLKELVHISTEKRRWSLQQRTLKKAKETAEAAALAKSRFLANMSHEIRTPMTSILGYTEMLQRDHLARVDDMKPEEMSREFYEKIIEQCRSTTRIIQSNAEFLLSILNDILDYSKMDADKMTFETIDIPTVSILRELSAFYSIQAKKKELGFSIKALTTIPAVIRTDPVRIKQILVNLVGNAIKFTLKGEVVVSVAWVMEEYSDALKRDERNPRDATEKPFCGGNLFFSIKDTGIGISSSQLSSLMTPFHQADPSTTRRFGGTGLGLAISKRLIQLLGGELLISSREGEGSTFTVILPQKFEGKTAWKTIEEVERETSDESLSDIPAAESKGSFRFSGRPLEGLRILLAEDGKDNQRLFSFILDKAGAEVHVADNGRVALDLALEDMRVGRPFDVILMDMQMPVMDGYTTTRRLRNGGYTHPIIALTAHALVEERQKCIGAGCNDYATKPILRDDLIETILRNVRPRT